MDNETKETPDLDNIFPEFGPQEFVARFDRPRGRFWIGVPVMGVEWESLKLFVTGHALFSLRQIWVEMAQVFQANLRAQQEREMSDKARIHAANGKMGLMAKAAGLFKGR